MKNTATLLVLMFAIGMVNGQNFSGNSSDLKSVQTTNHRLDSIIHYEWDEDISEWIKYRKEEHIYDEMLQYTNEYHWDEYDNQWEMSDIQEFIFNSNGNIIEISEYEDVKTEKYVLSYDNSEKLDYGIGYERDDAGSEWEMTDSTNYSFDENEKIISEIDYEWNGTTSEWEKDSKHEYSYDESGNMINVKKFEWSEVNSEWIEDESEIEEYFYDENGYLTFQKTGYETMKYNYDVNSNMTQELFGSWDPETDEGLEEEATRKIEFSYDLSVDLDELILPFNDDNEPLSEPLFIELVNDLVEHLIFNNKPVEMISYDRDDNDAWEPEIRAICYYSEQNTTQINSVNTTIFQMYPNPVDNFVQLELNNGYETITIQLFDIQGRRLLNKEISNNEKIDLSDLNRGIYLYSINAGENIVSGKLIKE